MNRQIRIFIALLAFVIFLIICAITFKDDSKTLIALFDIPAYYLAIASMMFLLNIAVRAIFNWLILRKIGHDLPFINYATLFYFTTALSFFVPLSGSVYSARYLKTKYDISITDFLGTFGSFNVLLCFASSVIGVIVLGFSWFMAGPIYLELFFVLSSIIIATILMAFLRYKRIFTTTVFTKEYADTFGGLLTLCTDITLLILSTATVFGLIITTFAAIWSLFAGYAASVDPVQLFLLVISQVLAGSFPFVPGGLGVQESFAVSFGGLMELDIAALLAIFVLWRVLRAMVLLVLLLPTKHYLKTHG